MKIPFNDCVSNRDKGDFKADHEAFFFTVGNYQTKIDLCFLNVFALFVRHSIH